MSEAKSLRSSAHTVHSVQTVFVVAVHPLSMNVSSSQLLQAMHTASCVSLQGEAMYAFDEQEVQREHRLSVLFVGAKSS